MLRFILLLVFILALTLFIVGYFTLKQSKPTQSLPQNSIILPSTTPEVEKSTETTNNKTATKSGNIKRPKSVVEISATKTEEGVKIVWQGTGEDVKAYSVHRCFGEYLCLSADEQSVTGSNAGKYIFVDIPDPKNLPDKYYVSAIDWLGIESVSTKVPFPGI